MKELESKFKSWDGCELFYRSWIPEDHDGKALILFHRGHEHSARWRETVEALALPGVSVFAWDQRGHGNSPGERGSAAELMDIVRDAEAFSQHLAVVHGIAMENTVVIAHSVGAVIAAAWIHDFAPPIRGLVLGAPAFKVKLYIPLAIPLLRLKQHLLGPGHVKSYVKSKFLTHDSEQARIYDADKAIFRQISVKMLLDLFDTSKRIVADAGAIVAPTLLLAAESDWIVHTKPQLKFFEELSSAIKRFEVLPGFHHALFHERDRKILVDKVRAFATECFAHPPQSRADLLNADESGYSKRIYDKLTEPGGIKWAAVRAWMNSVGRLSQGISLGWRSGFDSGVTLDYVYENRPRGTTPLGKLIDKFYLESPGWSGIRIRRTNLENVLDDAVDRLLAERRPVQLLDIAAGAGRYVLSTMSRRKDATISAHLRDYRQENLDAAQRTASDLGVKNVRFERGDAFDRQALAAIEPKPTIVIVSGLYELFPKNQPLRESLAGIAEAIAPEGFLVYTNQPWHPQAEFIAKALRNREGQPWAMRCRTQAEMDELVRNAGFEKIRQEIDSCGIFTVSLARRA